MSAIKTFFTALLLASFLTGCNSSNYSSESNSLQNQKQYIDIKYRDDDVDVSNGNFEYLDTSGSSLVTGAWFDASNDYMIIGLDGTYYHYCGMPMTVWESFEDSESLGTYYSSYIKNNYDCRNSYTPVY